MKQRLVLQMWTLKGGIITGDDGTVYAVSDGNPDAVFAIDPATGTATVLASGTPFANLDVFITLTPDGDLIVADDEGGDTIWRVDTGDGSVSTFLVRNAAAGDHWW